MEPPPRRDARRRIGLLIAGLLFIALVALLALRGLGVADRRASLEAFEHDIAPLELRPAATLEAADSASVDGALERLGLARELYAGGLETLEAPSDLDPQSSAALLETVIALEDHRRQILSPEPRLVDLIVSLAVSRFGLDLTASLLSSTTLDTGQLDRLAGAFRASSDDLGVAEAMVWECQSFLAETGRQWAAPQSFGDRFYVWLYGPAEQASAVRLYHGLLETLRQPILDVPGHLDRRAKPQPPALGLAHGMLIPNLQQVPIDHRRQLTGRQLLRLAIDLRRAALRGEPLEPVSNGAPAGAVTGEAPILSFGESSVDIDYRAAREHQTQEGRRPETAPPAFPLRLSVPLPEALPEEAGASPA